MTWADRDALKEQCFSQHRSLWPENVIEQPQERSWQPASKKNSNILKYDTLAANYVTSILAISPKCKKYFSKKVFWFQVGLFPGKSDAAT
jgi:hypothetical protein